MKIKVNSWSIFRPLLFLILLLNFCACTYSTNRVDEPPSQWQKFKAIFDINIDKKQIQNIKAKYSFELQDYESTFSFINGINKHYYDSLLAISTGEVSINQPRNLKIEIYDAQQRQLNPDYRVFGWHPFWMKNAYESYNYSLLSYVSWFSYDIDAQTGSYSNPSVIDSLRSDGPKLLELAHAQKCQVLLTITNHGSDKNRLFLENGLNQEAVLLDSVLHLVTTLGLDGLDINFENIPSAYGKKMSQFVKNISDKLKSLNPNYTLSLTIPKLNNGQVANIESLNNYVDIFVLTGYDFHTVSSSRDGPIAPLKSTENNKYSIESVTETYLKEGVLPKKLILALPYYGAVWRSTNNQPESKNRNFKRHLTYRAIMAAYGDKAVPKYFPDLESAYFLNQKEDKQFEKIWFDDSLTLKTKFDWAKKQELGGVGIWALGYDNGRNELWRALDKTFAEDAPSEAIVETGQTFKVLVWLSDFDVPLMMAAIFFSIFVGLGFLVSLFDWRVRNYLFENKSSRLVFILTVFGSVLLIYLTILFLQNEAIFTGTTTLFLSGLLLGAILVGVIVRVYRLHRERLP